MNPLPDPARNACQERCAEFGDPLCYEIHEQPHGEYVAQKPWQPCADCLSDIGVEVVEPLDPGAVVRPLL